MERNPYEPPAVEPEQPFVYPPPPAPEPPQEQGWRPITWQDVLMVLKLVGLVWTAVLLGSLVIPLLVGAE